MYKLLVGQAASLVAVAIYASFFSSRYITKDELSRIVKAVYDLMGRAVEPLVEEHTTREHVERVFNRLDLNKDGVVTIDEFMDSCTKVTTQIHSPRDITSNK